MDEPDRIARLEERLAWHERHAIEQDRAVLELAERVERLRKECTELRQGPFSGGKPDGGGLPDERPPHY